MATWEELQGFINSNYTVKASNEFNLQMVFDLGDGRSQLVFVGRAGELGDSTWAGISTIIANENQIDHRDLLRRNADLTVGAIALLENGTVVYTYTIRLEDLDINEFEVPLRIVLFTGDELEKVLTGEDAF